MSNRPNRDEPGWHLVVDPSSDGQRLDRFIASRIVRVSRARASRLHVVDLAAPTIPLKKSASVREGQELWVSRPIPDADVEVPTPKVLVNTEQFVIIDKPAGLAVHPSASRFRGTVTHWLASNPEFHQTKPAHRLDVETSGVLVCTRPPTEFEMGRIFAEHRAKKTYLAVIEGRPPTEEWVVDTSLGFDEQSTIRLKMGPGSLPAETRFIVRRRGPSRTLVEAHPITGRQHQIRVHLQMSGYPIVGDKLYGPDEHLFIDSRSGPLSEGQLARLGHHRQALHAWKIELPLESGTLSCEAPLPQDLADLLSMID